MARKDEKLLSSEESFFKIVYGFLKYFEIFNIP
jgi:hypothetical protein